MDDSFAGAYPPNNKIWGSKSQPRNNEMIIRLTWLRQSRKFKHLAPSPKKKNLSSIIRILYQSSSPILQSPLTEPIENGSNCLGESDNYSSLFRAPLYVTCLVLSPYELDRDEDDGNYIPCCISTRITFTLIFKIQPLNSGKSEVVFLKIIVTLVLSSPGRRQGQLAYERGGDACRLA